MIVLDTAKILTAVKLSLESHVLPALSDDFARVQVLSAVKALAEVSNRLENGDPAQRSNAIIESGVRDLAASIRSESPDFAARLDQAVETKPEGDAPRDRSRQLGGALWDLCSKDKGPEAARLLALLQAEALRTMSEDNAWICPEAIESLT
jgi:HAMP domain-containing protein